MPRRTLKCVSRTQGNNRALKAGEVTVDGFDLSFVEVPVLVDAFHEMVANLSYDVCEMSMATYLCAREHGVPFTAIPAFIMRGLHHGATQVRRRGPIRTPADLAGTTVGVNRGYTVTTSLWARGILADEYGVDLEAITWARSGAEHVSDFQPPSNVVEAPSDRDLRELLLDGEVAAVTGAAFDHPDIGPLIPDPREAALSALRGRGLYPINHLIVIRDDVIAEHPGLPDALTAAFTESRDRYLAELTSDRISDPTPVDRLNRTILDLGSDPLPYGIDENRENLETVMRYAVEQHVLQAPLDIDALFRPVERVSS